MLADPENSGDPTPEAEEADATIEALRSERRAGPAAPGPLVSR